MQYIVNDWTRAQLKVGISWSPFNFVPDPDQSFDFDLSANQIQSNTFLFSFSFISQLCKIQ